MVLEEIGDFCEKKLKHKTAGNPDFWKGEFESLGVEEGRMLKEMQEKKALGGGRKVFVLATESLTREAQNSLLKVFEEPTQGTHFFLVVPSLHVLLPTLRSRVFHIEAEKKNTSEHEAETFLAQSKGKRLIYVKKITDAVAGGEQSKTCLISFVDALVQILRRKIRNRPLSKKEAAVFEELLCCRDYLSDRSCSAKMILEHIAFLVE